MHRIKKTYKKHKKIIDNFSYLSLLKSLTLIVPLLTFPYLIRVLGAEKYGLVMWAWSIAQIFVIIVQFGFDTLGVKLISQNRNSKKRVSFIFSQIIYAKTFLLILNLVVYFLLLFFVEKMALNRTIFVPFAFFIIFESMLPTWYFQGVEEIKVMAILTSIVRLAFTFLVFLFVKEKSDYFFVPILYAVSSFASNFIAFYLIFFKDKLFFTSLHLKRIIKMMSESFFIFFATVGTLIRDRVTIILIEKFLGLSMVAYFDLAIRIINILLTPFHMLTQVLYPHIAKTKELSLLKKVLIIVSVVSFFVVVLFFLKIDWIVTLINGKMNYTLASIMKILIFIVPLGAFSSLIGTNVLIVFNKTKWLSVAIFTSTIVYLLTFTILYLNNKLTIQNFGYLFVLFFVVELCVKLFVARKIFFRSRLR